MTWLRLILWAVVLPVVSSSGESLRAMVSRESALTANPPKDISTRQFDEQLAELRWKIAMEYGADDFQAAISYAKASLSLDPGHASRWETLGDLHNFSGELTSARDAATAYENALALEPDRRGAELKAAAAWLMYQRPLRALQHLEKYLSDLGNEADDQAISLYAAASAAALQTGRGVDFIREQIRNGADSRYRIAWAILENAADRQITAMAILSAVEKSEGPSALGAYAARLRKTYEAGL